MDSLGLAREKYILKELKKLSLIFTVANWIVIGLVVLFLGIAAFRMINGTGLLKMTIKLILKFFWVVFICLYTRHLETRYKTAARETEQVINDPLFKGFSETAQTVRNSVIKSATQKKMFAFVWAFMAVFFLFLGAILLYACATSFWNPLYLGILVFFLVAGLIMAVQAMAEWKGAPEGKRLFGNDKM